MAHECVTMPVMSTREDKPKRGPGRPPSDKAGKGEAGETVSYSVRVPPDLNDALVAYLKTLRPTPGVSETFRTALEDFLQTKGFWSPKD